MIYSVLCEDAMLSCCHFCSIQKFVLFNNINKVDLSFAQLDTKQKVNILLYGYPPNKSNALDQDVKFVINYLKKSGCFDKPLISFNQLFYLRLFFVLLTKFITYNWLQISCIKTSSFLLLFLFVTSDSQWDKH